MSRPLPTPRRLALVLVLAAGACLTLLPLLLPLHPKKLNPGAFEQITEGMILAEVEALMGGSRRLACTRYGLNRAP